MAKKPKLTIYQKLRKRKYRPAPKFISAIYKIIMVDIIGRKYKPNFHIIDDVNDCDGPCFVIFNHLYFIFLLYFLYFTFLLALRLRLLWLFWDKK